MIFTLPVILYQLLLVAILFVASRFGRAALIISTLVCLAWTATHLFFVPLAVMQSAVILTTAGVLYTRSPAKAVPCQ